MTGHAHSATPVLPINSPSAYKIPAFINNIRVNFLLDTGAAVSLIRRDVWEQVNAKKQQQLSPTGHHLVGVDGTPLKILGTARVGIRIGQELFSADLIILESLTIDAIFGLDFLQANQCIIGTHSKQIQFADRNMKLPLSVALNEAAAHVTLGTTLHIPPSSEIEVMAKVQEPTLTTGTWIVEGAATTHMPIRVAHGLVHVRGDEVPVRPIN